MTKNRIILHSDLNNFYASVELLLNPTLKDKFVAVCGSVEERHGIVLAKNEKAKKLGVKTGMTIWEAKNLCPELITVEANMDTYLEYSNKVRKIYSDYTDRIEPFGIDESWLDVTHSKMFGTGKDIAEQIRNRVKKEVGLTVSIGVSFNKIFAKIGSDLKKPDAITEISVDNFKSKVWCLDVKELLYVGKSTENKLKKLNIKTIGDLALTEKGVLIKELGKWGEVLFRYANGEDDSPVINAETESVIKSVGNSMTTYKDLETIEEVKSAFYYLADSVVTRVISHNLGKPRTLNIFVRDNKLNSINRQTTIVKPTILITEICKLATEVFTTNYAWDNNVRTIGLSLSNFSFDDEQTEVFENAEENLKKENAEKCMALIKSKYCDISLINKGIAFSDKKILTKKLSDKPIFK